jgi:hypothetical protein
MIRNPVGLQVRSYTSILDLQTHARPPIMGQTSQTCINFAKQSGTWNEGEGVSPYLPKIVWELAKHKNSILKSSSKKGCPLIF